MSSNTSFVAQQLRGNTILEAYFVKTSDMLLEFQLKSNMNDTTILTNFGGAKLYDKNNIHTKVRNLWNRNVLGLNVGAHISYNCIYNNIYMYIFSMYVSTVGKEALSCQNL